MIHGQFVALVSKTNIFLDFFSIIYRGRCDKLNPLYYYTVSRTSRVARVWSNYELKKVAHYFKGDIVNVSGWDDRDKQGNYYGNYFLNKDNYFITNLGVGERGYQDLPNEIELNLTDLLPKKLYRRFDVAYNHTTLEHIFEVFTAFKNICNLSKDVVIIIVPFVQNEHGQGKWGDYWRFAPGSLREMFRRNGLQVVYESESPFRNSAVYLFYIASRYPDRWRHLMPCNSNIKKAGAWIGRAWLPRKINKVIRRYRKLFLKPPYKY